MAETLADPLALRRRATPARTAIVDGQTGEAVSYASVDDAADRVGTWIETAVGGSTPTIAVLADRHPAIAPLVWGSLRAGARIAPLDTTLPSSALADRFERLDADALVSGAASAAAAEAIDPPLQVELDGRELSLRDVLDPSGTADAGTRAGEHARDEAEGELVVFTSGSTGEPKGVRLDLPTLVASATASTLRLGATPADRWLVPIPTYHVGGLAPLVRCTQAGTAVVLQPAFDAEATIDLIDDRAVTCTSLVPTQLERLLDAGWTAPERFRFVLLGGGPIRPALVERCAERGVPVCPTYGTTETASQVATARPAEAIEHPGTVGQPLAFTDVTVLAEGQERPADTVGEIVVDGPTVTAGYLEGGREGDAFGDHGFHTGDLGRFDAQGRLAVEGRLDDRILTGGEVVDATRVREVIRELDGVVDAAVVGLADPEWGERVAALVEVADGRHAPDGAAVRAHCRERLPPAAVPKTVGVTAELPRTASGTIERAAVTERLR